MGCFNIQDAITKNTLTYSDKCKFMFISNCSSGREAPINITDNWAPVSTIFTGNYNDYGTMEGVHKCRGLKIFEDYFKLDIDQILNIVRNNHRGIYSHYSPIIEIFKGEEEARLFRDKEVALNNITMFSDKFILERNKLKYIYRDNQEYFTFDINEHTCIIERYYFDYKSKEYVKGDLYEIKFKYLKLLDFFEEIYKKTNVLFGFELIEELRIKKLYDLQLFVFSESVFDYIISRKELSTKSTRIIKELKNIEEISNKMDSIQDKDSDEYFDLELNLDDSKNIHMNIIPTNYYIFRNIYKVENLIKLKYELDNFIIVMSFLELLNIGIYPSRYAPQETKYLEEYEFHKFCSEEAISRYRIYMKKGKKIQIK